MRLNRTKNAKKNIAWGLCNKVVFMFFPFVIRAMIIQTVGAEYLGLDSLFVSILQVLSLAELGFGEAIVYSMYRPIANNDKVLVGKILGFYRKIYRRIGLAILSVGFLLMPFLTNLVHGSYPAGINIYVLYCIYLFNTVISYWLYAYKQSLLNAYMQQYIIVNVNMIVRLAVYIIQFLILWLLKNFYLYVLMIVINTVINNLILNYYVDKYHPEICSSGKLNKEIKADVFEKIKGLIIGKVTGVFRNAMGNVFVSSFVGLVTTGIYSNYMMIFVGIQGFFMLFYESLVSGIGNSIALETKKKNYEDLTKLDFIYMCIAGWVTASMCCLYQPFTRIVFGENMAFDDTIMILFCVYFYVLRIGDMLTMYAAGNGLWWEMRYFSIGETLINLVLTYILGSMFGVGGVLLATIISLLMCGVLGNTYIVFYNYFIDGIKLYIWRHIKYFSWTMLIIGIMYTVGNILNEDIIVFVLVKILLCLILPPIMYLLRYRRTTIYIESITWILNRIKFPEFFRRVMIKT